MPDPDLVLRAQLAGAALESAWQRWRVVHGLTSDQLPTVSSYVGYTIEEPWGQPRVVFGLAAQDAEQLASLLERQDDQAIVYTAAGAVPATRDLSNGDGARSAALSVPPQAPPTAAQPRANVLSGGYGEPGFHEPLYQQAAAAMKGTAPGRVNADSDEQPDDQADAERSAEPLGALARAASAARAAAEARIKASFTEPPEAPAAEVPQSAASAKGPATLPKIQATEVLEPLPGPGAAKGKESKVDGGSRPEAAAGHEPKVEGGSQPKAAASDQPKVDADSPPAGQKAEPKKHDEPGVPANDEPKEAPQAAARRGRMPKAPIGRIPKPKRPPTASVAQEQPERSEPSERPERTQPSAP